MQGMLLVIFYLLLFHIISQYSVKRSFCTCTKTSIVSLYQVIVDLLGALFHCDFNYLSAYVILDECLKLKCKCEYCICVCNIPINTHGMEACLRRLMDRVHPSTGVHLLSTVYKTQEASHCSFSHSLFPILALVSIDTHRLALLRLILLLKKINK